MASLVYGLIRAASAGWTDPGTLLALTAGLALLAAFVWIELRTDQPLLPLRLFAERNRSAAYLNFFLGPMAMMSMFFFLTQFLQEVDGLTPLATGFAFLPMAAILFAMTRLIPRLLPRFGPKPPALIGTALMVAGLAWLTRITPDTGYLAGLLGPMALMGLGGGLAFAPLNVIIMSTVPPADAGAAGGVLQTMQQTGATFGLAVLVTVFGSVTRSAQPGTAPAEVMVSGMTSAFAVATCFAAATFAVALSFRREATASGPRRPGA
jgi:predicted MFS family arabinose efflux permease